jgi:phospholipase/carboxylesterase
MTSNKKSISNDFNYVSYGPTKGKPEKLVFAFHGFGRDASLMQKLAEAIVKESPTTMVIMPNGPEKAVIPRDKDGNIVGRVPEAVRNNEKYKKLYKFKERQWFSIQGDINQRIKESDSVADRLNKFIDKKRDEFGLKDKDIAITGFSQGGFVALRTAFNREAEVGCVVGHSCFFIDGPNTKSKPSTLFIYGTADEDLSQDIFNQTSKALKEYGVPLTEKKVRGLTHKTNDKSREISAKYIANKLSSRKKSFMDWISFK